VKHGLAGRVLATAATIDLAELILRDSARLQAQDAQFIESTYGDRNHRPYSETVTEFEELVKQAVETRRRILVPIRCGACPANALSPCDHVPP
jgi:Cft2 family RNA processing exonuclease